jgi:hypothetical protein
MSQDQRALALYRFDDLSTAILMRMAVAVALLIVATAIWLGLGPAQGVVAVALLAGGFTYFFHLAARKWVTLSDDNESIELRQGEKAALQALGRLSWDSDLLRAGIALASAATGATIGVTVVHGQWNEAILLVTTLWTTLFVGFYAFTKFDQLLARAYFVRGRQKLETGDLAAAIGDASESLLLSMKFRFEAFMLRGHVWMRVGDLERAQREFQMAWSVRPGSEEARSAYRAAVLTEMANAAGGDEERRVDFAHLTPTKHDI